MESIGDVQPQSRRFEQPLALRSGASLRDYEVIDIRPRDEWEQSGR